MLRLHRVYEGSGDQWLCRAFCENAEVAVAMDSALWHGKALQKFRVSYNWGWTIQRHRYLTPAEARMRTIEREGVVS